MAWHPATHITKAFKSLDHDAVLANGIADEKWPELIFTVTTGHKLVSVPERLLERSAIWTLDHCYPWYRLQYNHECIRYLAGGGRVFCSQSQDIFQLQTLVGGGQIHWLPFAHDPDEYGPGNEKKEHFIGFAGGVYDPHRDRVLTELSKHFDVKIIKPYELTGKAVAAFYRKCEVVLNPHSFFGRPFAYGVNMRWFEACACGAPVLGSYGADMPYLGFTGGHAMVFHMLENALGFAEAARDGKIDLPTMARSARTWAKGHTYEARARHALEVIGAES